MSHQHQVAESPPGQAPSSIAPSQQLHRAPQNTPRPSQAHLNKSWSKQHRCQPPPLNPWGWLKSFKPKSSISCTRLRQDPVLSSTDLHQLRLTQTCCLQLSSTSGQEEGPQVVLVDECLRKSLVSLSNTALRSALAFFCYHKVPFQACAVLGELQHHSPHSHPWHKLFSCISTPRSFCFSVTQHFNASKSQIFQSLFAPSQHLCVLWKKYHEKNQ